MISSLIAILGGIYLVIKFIKSLLIKYVGFAIILTAQFAITASVITFVIVFYTFTITALVSIYNKGIDIFNYVSTSTSGPVTCLFGLADCIGLTPALQNGFTMMYGVLSTVVIFHLLKFTFSAMKIIANELFKLGVLLGQALK